MRLQVQQKQLTRLAAYKFLKANLQIKRPSLEGLFIYAFFNVFIFISVTSPPSAQLFFVHFDTFLTA